MLRSIRWAVLLAFLLAPIAATAQMTPISQVREIETLAEIFDSNTGEAWGWGDYDAALDFQIFGGYIYAGANEVFGYSDAEASQESSLDPSVFMISNYVYSDAELFDLGYEAVAWAISKFEVNFSVSETTTWNLDGTLEAHANGLVDIVLYDSFGSTIMGQSWFEMFPPLLVAESGTLEPGTYTLIVEAYCFDEVLDSGFYSASEAAVNLEFSASGATSPVGDTLAHDQYLRAGPNPMQNNTTIAFAGAPGQSVELDVFDVRGRRVRRLLDAGGSQGQVAWDGRDNAGQNVPQGIYFVRMSAGQDVLQRKVTVVR